MVIFLEQAELRVNQQIDLTLDFWRKNVDGMLEFSDQRVLKGQGRISHDEMKEIAYGRYEVFDQSRREAEALSAEAEDLKELEDLDKKLKSKKNNKKP